MTQVNYNLTGIADNKMRAQIGAVCIHWSLLELMVERVIANLGGSSQIVTYTEDLAHRLDTLKKLAKAKLSANDVEDLRKIRSEISRLKEERHRIVHGLWGLDTNGNIASIFPRTKSQKLEKPMTTQDVRTVKLEIWQANAELKKFADLSKSPALAWPRKPKR